VNRAAILHPQQARNIWNLVVGQCQVKNILAKAINIDNQQPLRKSAHLFLGHRPDLLYPLCVNHTIEKACWGTCRAYWNSKINVLPGVEEAGSAEEDS
jgi:hypothetical protein